MQKTTYLVARAQGGDRGALEDLFARYSPRVHRIVALRLGRSAKAYNDVEDIAQEALTKTFKNLDRFEHRSEGSFRNWLSRCVENAIIDHFKHAHAKKRGAGKVRRFGDWQSEGLPELIFPSGGPTASEILRAAELEQRIEAALLELPSHQREIIILRRLCEMPYRELAQVLGFEKEGTARQMFARAMDKLEHAIAG